MVRALIVDDDEPIRSMLATIVRHHGFAVETASDGGQAIESIARDGFDVVLLDLMMPRVNGYEFIDRITAVAGKPWVMAASQRTRILTPR